MSSTTVIAKPVDFLGILEEPVKLHSGGMSQFLIDARGLYDDDRMRMAIIAYWKEYLDRVHSRHRFHFISIPKGGVPWAETLYKVMQGDARGQHRLSEYGEDFTVKDNRHIIVVDDVLTTGRSVGDVARLTLGQGIHPTIVLTVVDRRWKQGPVERDQLWLPDLHRFLGVQSWATMPLPTEVV